MIYKAHDSVKSPACEVSANTNPRVSAPAHEVDDGVGCKIERKTRIFLAQSCVVVAYRCSRVVVLGLLLQNASHDEFEDFSYADTTRLHTSVASESDDTAVALAELAAAVAEVEGQAPMSGAAEVDS